MTVLSIDFVVLFKVDIILSLVTGMNCYDLRVLRKRGT